MKKFLSLVLALVMTMSLVTISAGAKGFDDASSIEYTEAVEVMKALKVIDGYTDGSFRPSTELNRAQAAKIICNMVLGPTTAEALSASSAPFSDVPADHWAAGYITFCVKEGFVDGYADGSFRPTAPLTGYAFMKMLLTALGYDAEMEGYVGANWGVNVAKQAIGIGLDDGNDEFVGTKIVTREEACLYAFNTLTATMVKYGSKTTVNVNGATVVVGGSDANEVEGTGYKSYKTGAAQNYEDTLEFCEKYFPNLRLQENDSDDFGRPANTWKIKTNKIGSYAKTPDLTYSVAVKGDDIYEDLGKPDMENKNDVVVDAVTYTNGKDDEATGSFELEDNEDKIGGKGTTTEVYTKENDDYVAVTIVVVDNYVGKIDSVVEADEKNNDDRYVTVDGEDYETEEFEEDDFVLYTMADGSIKTMKLAESVMGVDVEKVNKTAKTFVADGESYELSATCTGDKAAAVAYDKTVDIYFDDYGYVAMVVESDEAEAQYAVVYAVQNEAEWTEVDASEAKSARFVMADGSKTTVKATKEDGVEVVVGDTGALVAYTYDEDDDEYNIEEVGTQALTAAEAKKGSAKIAGANDAKIYGTSKTVYFFQEESGKSSYDVYVGYKNAPSFEGANVYAIMEKDSAGNDTKYAKAVLVTDYQAAGSAEDLIFVVVSKGGEINDVKHDFYEYNAIVDKAVDTFKVDYDVPTSEFNCTNFNAEATYMILSGVKTTNGNATEVTVADGEDPEIIAGAVTSKYSSTTEVIKVDDLGYALADNAVFFAVDEDGEITKTSVSKMYVDDEVVLVLNDDGQIDMIINVEKLG